MDELQVEVAGTAERLDKNSRQDVRRQTAKILLDIKAVLFNVEEPFTLTSGSKSPVYIDCRKIISFPKERNQIIESAVKILKSDAVAQNIDMVAGGETAGIPYGAWISDRMDLPMLYVRKKPKGFGRMAQIEGYMEEENQNVLLVEDLTTDGASKITFCNVLRDAGAKVTDVFSVFYYDIFPESEGIFNDAGVKLHYLTTWHDVLAVAREEEYFDEKVLSEVEAFLEAPSDWSAKRGGVISN